MSDAVIYKILRWTTVVVALVFLISLSSGDADTNATYAQIETQVSAKMDLSLVQKADDAKLERFYGLRAADFANCILYIPTDGVVYVEELLLVELKDEAQKQTVLDAIDARLQTQKKTFENYNLFGQYEKLTQQTHIEVRGNFILFVISCDDAYQAFLETV